MKIYKLIASGLGTGYAPHAPGTVGALLGISLFYSYNGFLINFDLFSRYIFLANCAVLLLLSLVGFLAVKKVHTVWPMDSSKIVIDEIIGVWIAVIAVPFSWYYCLLGFLLFRFFDIVKPLYIKRIDQIKSNWSVILDDVVAGIYANLVLQIIARGIVG